MESSSSSSRRSSTRQRKPAHDSNPAEKELDAASSDEEETAAVVEVALLARKKPSPAGKTRSARERSELAKTTRVLKSRLELALFKVGRGWEGVRFERIEAAHSQQCGGDTTSSSVDLGDDVLEASQASSSAPSKNPSAASSSASSSSRTSASAHANASAAAGSTANWLERSAGQQEQLNSSLNGSIDDANQALLSPIKSSNVGATGISAASTPSTRQARSASTTSVQAKQSQGDDANSPSAAKMSASASSSSLPASSVVPPTRPATTRPSLTTSTSSLDCNPGPASARPRSDSSITTLSSSAGPMSAPPTTTTFSSPIANASNNDADEFATPATASRVSKRQRRESHQPRSSSKRQHATIQEEGSPPPSATASGSSASSTALNAVHLGHKRKISQNTLWHQSRAILSGIGGASASALSHASQSAASSTPSTNAFSAAHPGSQSFLNNQSAASLTSPVRLKPGQQRPHGTPQNGQHQAQMHSSPFGNLQQQSPQGYILSGQGSSVSPAGSSSGGTVRGAAVQTPRRPSTQMMQNVPHTIASSHHSHHQYVPHHPSNLGLASSSDPNNANNGQMQQYNLGNAASGDMMQQLSQQGQMLHPQQQPLYTFQSPQANQQPDYGYALYTQQPHIMQTPQHGQSSQMMQHPHTAPQLHHSQQQQGMLTVNGYATDYSGGNGMNVFGFGDPHAVGQSHLSPSYAQQQQMQGAYGNQMSPLNMSNGFRHQQSQPGSTQMGQTMSMQGLPSQQPTQQHQNHTMMRSQSAISHAPSEISTFTGSQPPPLDPSLRNANSSNGGSQESSSVDTNFSHQSAQAAQVVAAQIANGPSVTGQQQAGTRPGTANGPERETAAELMLYLAASPSPQQSSKKVGNTALGGGDLSQVKGRKLFGNEDASAQQQRSMPQNQQQLAQIQQPHRNSVSNHSQTSAGSGLSGDMSKSQSQMGMQQDHNNPFAVQHTYPGMTDQNAYVQQQQLYSSNGSTDMQAAQLAQPFEYNQAMQFDPYAMMTAQGVTLDQEFGSGW